MNDELKNTIKLIIVDSCKLQMDPGDIGDEDQLIGEDSALGLDSVDALGLVIGIEGHFGITIEGGKDDLAMIFRSVNSIAQYLMEPKR